MSEEKLQLKDPVKYLFGRVHVEIVRIEEHGPEKAFEKSKDIFGTPAREDDPNHEVFMIPWAEGGDMPTEIIRQNILGAFLELMDKIIPKTPSDCPRIIIPGQFQPGEFSREGSSKKL